MAKEERGLLRRGFDEILLIGVILLTVTAVLIGIWLYITPSENLEIPELQPVIRVARVEDFPVGSSRVRNWGSRTIMIVRPDSSRFVALQGTSPADGCVLRWDEEALRLFSPCRHAEYDLKGDVIAGLSTQALQRYSVSVRDGVLYVSEERK